MVAKPQLKNGEFKPLKYTGSFWQYHNNRIFPIIFENNRKYLYIIRYFFVD